MAEGWVPLAGDFAFKLGKGQQHIEGQPTHRRGGIERLRDRHKRGPGRIHPLDDLGEVSKRAGKSIDLVNDDGVETSRPILPRGSIDTETAAAPSTRMLSACPAVSTFWRLVFVGLRIVVLLSAAPRPVISRSPGSMTRSP